MADRGSRSSAANAETPFNDSLLRLTRFGVGDAALVSFLFVLSCAFFWKVIVHPTHLVAFWDIVIQYYPWRYFALLEPGALWLPVTFGGEPFIANPQIAAYYPVDWALSAVLPLHLALGYGLILHFFLAGAFTYCLGRYLGMDRTGALSSGVVFMLSAYLVTHAWEGHYSIVTATAWLPLILLLCMWIIEKPSLWLVGLTGLAFGVQLLTGHPQTSFFTMLLVGSYTLYESARMIRVNRDFRAPFKGVGSLCVALALGIGLAAAQLLPTYEFAGESTRSGGVSFSFATSKSLPWHNLVGIVLPNLFGTPTDRSHINTESYWEVTFYAGVVPLVLAAGLFVLRKRKAAGIFFGTVGILSVVLALGANTPVYRVLWKLVPGFDLFRAPARFMVIFTLALALLAGLGLSVLQSHLSQRERKHLRIVNRVLMAVAVLLGLAALAGYVLMDRFVPELERLHLAAGAPWVPPEEFTARIGLAYQWAVRDATALVVFLSCAILLLWRRVKQDHAPPGFGALVLGVVIVNLWVYHDGFVRTRSLEETYRPPDHVDFLERQEPPFRVYSKDLDLKANVNIIYGLDTIDGSNPMQLSLQRTPYKLLKRAEPGDAQSLLAAWNVKYVVSRNPLTAAWLRPVFQGETATVYENDTVLPRSFVFPEPLASAMIDAKLDDPALDLRSGVLLDQTTLLARRPDAVTLEAEMAGPGLLVLSENYYPGWRVYVDGQEDELVAVFDMLRGVRLEQGRHRVEFVYEPSSIRAGARISGVVLAALSLMILVGIGRAYRSFRGVRYHGVS